MPNSEVKQLIADGSVALRHVRVGHRQASNQKALAKQQGLFFGWNNLMRDRIVNDAILAWIN